jgi:hypothetical protein
VVGTLKLIDFASHVIVCDDTIEALFIHISIIKGQCQSIGSKPSSTTNPMQVSIWLWISLSAWYVKVDDKLSLGHINTSSNQISCNEHIDLLLSESLHSAVSLLLRHLGEHDVGFEICLSQNSMHGLCKFFSVNKDEGLSQFANCKDLFDEFDFLALLTLHHILPDRL